MSAAAIAPLRLVTVPAPEPHTPQRRTYRPVLGAEGLFDMADRLWPDKPDYQRQWLRSVAILRASEKGWLLDIPRETEK